MTVLPVLSPDDAYDVSFRLLLADPDGWPFVRVTYCTPAHRGRRQHLANSYRIHPHALQPVGTTPYTTPPNIPATAAGTRLLCNRHLFQPDLFPLLTEQNVAILTLHTTTYLALPIPPHFTVRQAALSPDHLTAAVLATHQSDQFPAAAVVVFDLD
jgi:hypothetical protein